VRDPELDARRRSRGGLRRAFSAISAGISGRGGGRSATSIRLSIRLSNPARRNCRRWSRVSRHPRPAGRIARRGRPGRPPGRRVSAPGTAESAVGCRPHRPAPGGTVGPPRRTRRVRRRRRRLLTALLYRIPATRAFGALVGVVVQFRWTILTVVAVLALDYQMPFSGQTVTLGLALAATGAFFASPVAGGRLDRCRGVAVSR
jgi:hypothetical protein